MWLELTADEVLAATYAKWDLSGPLPVPAGGWLACPVCRNDQPQPRYWKFHKHGATVPWRCDVSFKCVDCAAVWVHGVAVDESYFRSHAKRPGRLIWWREARELLGNTAKAAGAAPRRAEPAAVLVTDNDDSGDGQPPAEK